jgi:hypothetical protein
LRSPHEGYPASPISMPTPDRSVRHVTTRSMPAGLCDRDDHDWDDWYAMPSSPEIQFRYCDRAGCSASQERPLRQGTGSPGRSYLGLRSQRPVVDPQAKPDFIRPSEQGGPR